MSRPTRLHPGQLVIMWGVAIAIEIFLFKILGAIDIPTEPVPGSQTPIGESGLYSQTLREDWMSGPGLAYFVVIGVMLAIAVVVLRKTWRWFGTSANTE